MKGKTKSGFKFDIDKEVLEDYEFLDCWATAQYEDNNKIFQTITLLLGDQQKKELIEHCRNEKGRVPVTDVTNEVAEIIDILSEEEGTKK